MPVYFKNNGSASFRIIGRQPRQSYFLTALLLIAGMSLALLTAYGVAKSKEQIRAWTIAQCKKNP
jgi:hypothetical protein